MSKFPERLAQKMSEMRFNNSTLGRSLGVTHSTVARWLNGSMPSGETLQRLAHELCVSVQWLLGDDSSSPMAAGSILQDGPVVQSHGTAPLPDDLESIMANSVRPIYQAPDEKTLWAHADTLYGAAKQSTGDLALTLALIALQEIRKRRKDAGESAASEILTKNEP